MSTFSGSDHRESSDPVLTNDIDMASPRSDPDTAASLSRRRVILEEV